MKKLISALLLMLSLPTYAQYTHRANPGVASSTPATITALNGSVCLNTEATDVAFLSVTGTWTATVSFFGSNDGGVTSKVLMLFPYNAAGGMSTSIANTTANGDFTGSTNSFRLICAQATAFTSGTVNVRIDSDPGSWLSNTVGLGFNGQNVPTRYCDKTANMTTLGTTATISQITGVAGQRIWLCGMVLNASTATAGTTLTLVEGSGANCVTSPTTVGNLIAVTPTAPATTPLISTMGQAVMVTATAGDSLCLQQGQAVNSTAVSGTIFYTIN